MMTWLFRVLAFLMCANGGYSGVRKVLKMRYVPYIIVFLCLVVLSSVISDSTALAARPVVQIELDGPIGPGLSDYVVSSIEEAQGRGVSAIVLRMDTPGGLDSSMREIIQAILDSKVPVIGYVGPQGARAASAGTYILMACHVAAMAPGTTIGAATPVAIGGGMPESTQSSEGAAEEKKYPGMQDKVINDSTAYIRGLAQMRGRNADWAAKFVMEAASVSDTEALAVGVIEHVAPTVRVLLTQINGLSVQVDEKEWILETVDADVVIVDPDWRSSFLALITNPNTAYILLLLGIYGLIFEFSNPGFGVPGIVGATALILGLYALHLLPINYAGLALIVLGMGLIMAEVFVPSFGALGIGGIIAFIIGSILLLDTDIPGFRISPVLIGTAALVTGAGMLFVLSMAASAWRRPVVSGVESLIGIEGSVLEWHGQTGRVHLHGEAWAASGPTGLNENDRVRVTGRDGLVLEVASTGKEQTN